MVSEDAACLPKPSLLTSLTEDNMQELLIKITGILNKIGIPVHIRGYYYLCDAIMMAVNISYEWAVY